MTLWVAAVWLEGADVSLAERLAKIVEVLKSPDVEEVFGPKWYYGGKSRKDALSKPAKFEDALKVEAWSQWRGPPPPPCGLVYDFNVWNGHDGASSRRGAVSVSLVEEPAQYVHDLPGRSGRVVFSCPILDVFANDKARVEQMLSFGRFLALAVRGTAAIRSHGLCEHADERVDEHLASYAAFWTAPADINDPDTGESISEYIATTCWTKEVDPTIIPRVAKLQTILKQLRAAGVPVP